MLPNVLLFALGVAALAAPVWVHLRLGRVKKRAVVSSLRLMKATPQTSRSPRRFVDIPLLLLRSLIVLLVALGFGRLLISGLRSNDAREYAAFVIDVSGSMQAESGGIKTWDQARKEALEGLSKLDATSRVAIVLSPLGRDEPHWESPAQAGSRVRELTPGFGANRLGASIREATRLLAAMPEDRPKVLHLVSDFQRSSLTGLDEVKLPSGVALDVKKVGAVQAQNRGVVVEVVSAGATDLGIYSFNDGNGGTLQLDENGAKRALALTPGNSGIRLGHSGKKDEWITRRLELKEPDSIAADNVAYDAFQAQAPIPVWLWEPSANARHAYEQSSYYIGRALQPSTGDGAAVSRYKPVVLTEKDLDAAVSAAGADDAPRLLILPATRSVPAALSALVRRMVEKGGSVIFFGGPLDQAAYARGFAAVLPANPGAAEKVGGVPALAEIPDSNPLLGLLDFQSRRQLEQAPLRQRHKIELLPGAAVLAGYSDGVPFIIERTVGRGRIEFVNTSSDREWGDWAASAPLFIPSMHLLAARALGDGDARASNPPVFAGGEVTLDLGKGKAGRSLKLGGVSYPVGADGRVSNVVFEKPGVFDLPLDDGTVAGKIAVNFPPSESVLECDPEAVVRQRLESLRQAGGSSVRWEGEERGGLAWRLCLFLAALLLVIEPVVANQRIKA